MSMYRKYNFQCQELCRTTENYKVPDGGDFILMFGICFLVIYTGVLEGRPKIFQQSS